MSRLLAAWRAHQDNRAARASVTELARSRADLDHAREVIFQLRRRLAPTSDDIALAVATIICDENGVPVLIRPEDVVIADGPVTYRCVCGRVQILPESLGRATPGC